MVNLKQPLQPKNTHQLVAEQNNIKELLDMESAAVRKLKAEDRAYKAVRARLESALKVLVSHYYSLFQPLHSRAEKHGYVIPEIFVDDYEFDDEEDSMPM